MEGVNNIGSNARTILTRQQDLTAQRGQNASDDAIEDARTQTSPVQANASSGQEEGTTNAAPDTTEPNVTNISALRDTTGTATPQEPPSPSEARATSSEVRVNEILMRAAEEGRANQAQQVQAEATNQPVAESEVGGTINVRI